LILGGYFIKTSVFLIVLATLVMICLGVIMGVIVSYDAPEWIGWVVLVVAGVLSAILAYITSQLIRLGIILISCWAGASVGATLFQTVGYLVVSEIWMLWSLMLVFALVFLVISFKFYTIVLTVSTSILGAFLFVRAIGFYAGGYPNEFELHNDIVSGAKIYVPWTVYVYVAAMVVLAIISFLWKQKKLGLLRKSRPNRSGYFDITS